MRTIKFKAWDKKEMRILEMERPSFLFLFKFYEIVTKKDSNFDVMQFTGLHDKNGKEIYEGDIVKYCDYNTTDRVWKTAEVQWMCWADWANVPFLHPFGSPVAGRYEQDNRSVNTVYVTPPNDCEVIGNVYENPELLN